MQFFEDENFSWRVLAVESFVIMLSVLLGFMLNGWRESSRQQTNVDTALRSITAEMQYNRQQMESHQTYFRTVTDTLNYLASKQGENTPLKINNIPGAHGLSVPILRASAFQTARSTGTLSDLDFKLTRQIFAYYRFQKFYTDLISKITNGLINDNFRTIRDWQRVFSLLKNNSGYVYEQRFEDVLSRLNDKYKVTPGDSAPKKRNQTKK